MVGGGVQANIEGGLRGINKDRSVPSPIPPEGQTLIYTHATYIYIFFFLKKEIQTVCGQIQKRMTNMAYNKHTHTHTDRFTHICAQTAELRLFPVTECYSCRPQNYKQPVSDLHNTSFLYRSTTLAASAAAPEARSH